MVNGVSLGPATSILPSIRQTICRSGTDLPQRSVPDPGGHRRHADAHVAPAALRREIRGEAKRAFQHAERGLEERLRRLELLKLQAAVLAELHDAALGEADLQAGAAAPREPVAPPELPFP